MSIENVLLEKSIAHKVNSNKVNSKPSRLRYDKFHIHYSKRRHTQKITSGHQKVLKLQKPVSILKKKIQNINPK